MDIFSPHTIHLRVKIREFTFICWNYFLAILKNMYVDFLKFMELVDEYSFGLLFRDK